MTLRRPRPRFTPDAHIDRVVGAVRAAARAAGGWATARQVVITLAAGRDRAPSEQKVLVVLDRATELGLLERGEGRATDRYRVRPRRPRLVAPSSTDIALAVLWVHQAGRTLPDGWVSARAVFVVAGQDHRPASVVAALEEATNCGLLEARGAAPDASEAGWPGRQFRVSHRPTRAANSRPPPPPPSAQPAATAPTLEPVGDDPSEITDGGTSVQARAAEIRSLLRAAGRPVSTSELVRRTGWTRSKVRRTVDLALRLGWIETSKSGAARIYWATDDTPAAPAAPAVRVTAGPPQRRALGRVPETLLEAR